MNDASARDYRNVETLAVGLGWFSIGLGLAELAAPRPVARLIGVREDPRNLTLIRSFGMRELGNGMAILAQPQRSTWLWSRVGGDVLDLACLGSAFDSTNPRRRRVAAATAAVLGVTALDVLCAQQLSRPERRARVEQNRRVTVRKAITIRRPVNEVYEFWKQLENLPRFMRHLESVRIIDQARSHWKTRGPAGLHVEWDAEIVDDRASELIAWRSLPGSDVENSGTVRFRPAPRGDGTELHVDLQYQPPAGRLGKGIAWLFGEEPAQQMADDLRRLKQLLELGEIPLSDGPALWRPAQPAETPEEVLAYQGGRP
ncbi:MAG: SRPBCC family protein [Acidobacteria bacterium]|nr:SRPBCC family protein [Acidobacteriota bacterium]